jgi:hypothetical protein
MMNSWWFLWMAFMFLLLAPPLGYGWGYRGWGPPYPRYVQRRRGQRAVVAGAPATFNHHAWGWGGDFVWMVFFAGSLCALSLAFWPR